MQGTEKHVLVLPFRRRRLVASYFSARHFGAGCFGAIQGVGILNHIIDGHLLIGAHFFAGVENYIVSGAGNNLSCSRLDPNDAEVR
uniref:Uncharacterized protein n=1 Tax=Romanomermis culicivorax TaxID=13658 RepID=A0A915IIV3_ROMCU